MAAHGNDGRCAVLVPDGAAGTGWATAPLFAAAGDWVVMAEQGAVRGLHRQMGAAPGPLRPLTLGKVLADHGAPLPIRALAGQQQPYFGREGTMIVDERTYTLTPNDVGQYLKLRREERRAVRKPILGRLVACCFTEFGTLNQVVRSWAADALEDRLACRARLFADPAWVACIPKIVPLLRQENRLLMPTAFMDVKWQD